MAKYRKWVLLGIAAALVISIAVVVFGVYLPYRGAGSAMPQTGEFIITQQKDGTLVLHWPEADQADRYRLEFLLPAETEDAEPEVVYRNFFAGSTECVLPRLPENRELIMRVCAEVEYRVFGQKRIRVSDPALEVTTDFQIPVITNLQWTADPDTDTVSISFQMREGDSCRYDLVGSDGEGTELGRVDTGSLELHFGDGGALPVPEFGESCTLSFQAMREKPGLKFYGTQSAGLTVTRDDLLDRNLNLQCVDQGNNVFALTWDETKGEHYEVQLLDTDSIQWQTVAQIAGDGERRYTSPHLAPFGNFTYRVVAVGGQTMEDSPYAAVSDEITYASGASAVFATIWPVKDLEAFRDSGRTESMGTVNACTAYCVLGEQDGMFCIRLNGETCYIDSSYCLINLSEYLGTLCRYEITNSEASIYMVHEFEIPDVTGVVTAGYENVRLSDGSYLVPLLYPTAQKLASAGQAAVEQGYRLKIYDSFRPNKATQQIYQLTEKILEDPVPEQTYTGVQTDELKLPEPEDVEVLTYHMVMTNGKYGLNYFLAKGRSMHNLGIALDLTLEDLATGREITMQTAIHDLSCYSVLSQNNSGANTLAKIMKEAGFGDLISEWWHFQDNEARASLSLPTIYHGVSAECWMADDYGWKYRTRKGTYYTGETVTIGDSVFSFDENGYVITR